MELLADPWRFMFAMASLALACVCLASVTQRWNKLSLRYKCVGASLTMYFFFQAWAAQDAAQEDIGFRWRVVVLLAGVLLIIFAFLLPDDQEKIDAKTPSNER